MFVGIDFFLFVGYNELGNILEFVDIGYFWVQHVEYRRKLSNELWKKYSSSGKCD